MEHSPENTAQSIGPLLDYSQGCFGRSRQGVLHARRIHLDWCALAQSGRMNREVWTPCPDCEEARVAAERRRGREGGNAARQRLEALLEDAAIPRRFIGRTLQSYNAVTPEQKARPGRGYGLRAENFAQKAKRGDSLILLGALELARATWPPPSCKPSCQSAAASTRLAPA